MCEQEDSGAAFCRDNRDQPRLLGYRLAYCTRERVARNLCAVGRRSSGKMRVRLVLHAASPLQESFADQSACLPRTFSYAGPALSVRMRPVAPLCTTLQREVFLNAR